MNLESYSRYGRPCSLTPSKPQVGAAESCVRKAATPSVQGAVYLGLNIGMFALHVTGKEIASSWLQLYIRIGYVLKLANCSSRPPQTSMAYTHTKGLILVHFIMPSSWQGLRGPSFFHIVAPLFPEPWSPPLDLLSPSSPSAEGERDREWWVRMEDHLGGGELMAYMISIYILLPSTSHMVPPRHGFGKSSLPVSPGGKWKSPVNTEKFLCRKLYSIYN